MALNAEWVTFRFDFGLGTTRALCFLFLSAASANVLPWEPTTVVALESFTWTAVAHDSVMSKGVPSDTDAVLATVLFKHSREVAGKKYGTVKNVKVDHEFTEKQISYLMVQN